MVAYKHVALRVPDLREAEGHYRAIFGADLVGREALLEDGRWYSAPPDRGWEEIEAAGIDIGWVGLRRDELVIALLRGEPDPGRCLYCIGVTISPQEVREIHDRLPDSVTVEVASEHSLTFVDRYGFRWQGFGPGFRTAGDARGDWLEF